VVTAAAGYVTRSGRTGLSWERWGLNAEERQNRRDMSLDVYITYQLRLRGLFERIPQSFLTRHRLWSAHRPVLSTRTTTACCALISPPRARNWAPSPRQRGLSTRTIQINTSTTSRWPDQDLRHSPPSSDLYEAQRFSKSPVRYGHHSVSKTNANSAYVPATYALLADLPKERRVSGADLDKIRLFAAAQKSVSSLARSVRSAGLPL
jgi:hypothetical protein